MSQRMLVAVDSSALSDLAVGEALKLAQQQHARLRLLHVVQVEIGRTDGMWYETIQQELRQQGQQIVDAAATRLRQAGIEVETILRESDGQRVGDVVVAEAQSWPADLIVVGTHGRRGLERLWLGSVAERITRAAPVPVLLVRGQ